MSISGLDIELAEAARRIAECRGRLAGMEGMLEKCQIPHPTHTCDGKGGQYEHLGRAIGAGTSKGAMIDVYRDCVTGMLFFRTPEDFTNRMLPLNPLSTEEADASLSRAESAERRLKIATYAADIAIPRDDLRISHSVDFEGSGWRRLPQAITVVMHAPTGYTVTQREGRGRWDRTDKAIRQIRHYLAERQMLKEGLL